MHETAIAEALFEQVDSFTPDGALLRQVFIEIGHLEHLDDEIMQAAWTARSFGTRLADSELLVTRVAVRIRCKACSREYEPEDMAMLLCPHCDAVQPEIMQGTGVLLKSLEVDQPDD